MANETLLPQPVGKALAATTAANLNDEWYLKAYKASGAEDGKNVPAFLRRVLPIAGSWKRVAIACSLGVCLGLGFASRRMPQTLPSAEHSESVATVALPKPEVATSVAPVELTAPEAKPVASPAAVHRPASAADDEATRLKIRNRRLEALVKVLRERSSEKRTPPDQTTYVGQ